ncbi:MAG TPA: c-type cytochrome [Terriglobia bacterium]|nr:c-type cytochrome [Terriglobia bacterium]
MRIRVKAFRLAQRATVIVTGLALTWALGAGASAALGSPGPAQAVPGGTAPAGQAPKTAGEAFKNIQVLKDVPADQLFPSMQFIAASLGVECNFCHVPREFDKDFKPAKQTARKMMQMMFAINRDNFNGHREVTCYSCHRGGTDPVGTPVIPDVEPPRSEHAEGGGPGAAPSGPTADQLLENYLKAAGGADAVQKITTRAEKGTLSGGMGGGNTPVEIFAKAPDQRISIVHMANREMVTAYNGHEGWLSGPGGQMREMTGDDLSAAQLDADFYFPAHLKQIFSQFRVRPPEKVGDQEAYVVLGVNPGKPPVRLYFDEKSGLLVREVRYSDTPLGRNPTQIDYADYHEADGVKVPFRWTIARPGGRFTIQVDQMQQNVPVDDAKFVKPADSGAPPPKPPSP